MGSRFSSVLIRNEGQSVVSAGGAIGEDFSVCDCAARKNLIFILDWGEKVRRWVVVTCDVAGWFRATF